MNIDPECRIFRINDGRSPFCFLNWSTIASFVFQRNIHRMIEVRRRNHPVNSKCIVYFHEFAPINLPTSLYNISSSVAERNVWFSTLIAVRRNMFALYINSLSPLNFTALLPISISSLRYLPVRQPAPAPAPAKFLQQILIFQSIFIVMINNKLKCNLSIVIILYLPD